MLKDFRGAGFAAVYMRAGLPEKFIPAFRTALLAQREYGHAGGGGDPRLSLVMVQRVITEREAAVEEARIETARIAEETKAPDIATPTTFSGVTARAPLIDLVAFEAELMAA